jgi:hypothetical protein
MEKVFFQNSSSFLTLSIYSGTNKLLSIQPQLEDSIFLPSGPFEIIVCTRLFGIKLLKERHFLEIKEGINNLKIQSDPVFDKNFSNELFLPNLLTGIYLVICLLNLKRSELNLAHFKDNPENIFLIVGFIFWLFLTSSYFHLFYKMYRRIKQLSTVFVVTI